MAATNETETFVQTLQRFHASLSTTQQRMLETILEAAQQTTTGATPDVVGYAAPTGTTNTPFTTLTRWLDTHTTCTTTGTTTGTTGRITTTPTTTTDT